MSPTETQARIASCLMAFEGVADPIAEVSRLRQIEARWNAIHDAQARTMAHLGDGVKSLLPDFAEICRPAPGLGPAPWIVVDAWPDPLLFLTPDGIWEGLASKAALHWVHDNALDEAELLGGHIVSLEMVQS